MSLNAQRYLKPIFKFMITVAIFLCIATYAFGQTQPRLINFQGKLTDQQGQTLDGVHTVIFSLYATATGGTALWTERHENLSISNGLVNALLGSIQSMDEPEKVVFDAPRYLGITIDVDNNENSPDPEMLPRQRLIPAIHAYNADKAEEAEKLTGGFGIVPIGTIMAWHKDLAKVPPLPEGWVECNGQTLTDPESPLNGQVISDLNGDSRFLRGSATSGTMQTAAVESHIHTMSGTAASSGSHNHSGSTNTTGNHSHSYDHYSDSGMHPDWAGAHGDDRGEGRSYSTGGAGSHSHSFTTNTTGSHTHTVSGTSDAYGGAETRPVNMSVVWIMRVK